jgi:hypothetical protein
LRSDDGESHAMIPQPRTVSRIVLLLAACVTARAATARAQSGRETGDRTRIGVELASEDMRRYPSLATALGQLANRGADVALDRIFGVPEGPGARAVAHRIVRTYLVSLPIAALSATAAHELGHVSRGHEAGLSFSRFRIAEWPWPVPVMSARLYVDASGDAPSELNELSVIAGGAEAAGVQEDVLLDTIYSGRSTNYFNWLLLADTKLEMPLYTWTDKGPPHYPVGDPGQFADEFGYIRALARFRPTAPGLYVVPTLPDRDAAWRTIRHGMWLNLADCSLAAAIVQTVKYVRTGNRETSVPALRRGLWAFVPALHFAMTSQGFERAVELRVVSRRTVSHSVLRWTDVPSGERLWATAIELRAWRASGWQPQVRADVFERTAGPVDWSAGGVGARVEAGARLPLHPGRRPIDVGFRVGYKTRGYLIDAPERRTLLGGLSLAVTF